ncbi:MAG: class I SAM-dependent methyltransferase [Gammaproteobacteria bacterium]
MGPSNIYSSPIEALDATDDFYRAQQGFGYDLDKVVNWLKRYVSIPKKGRILDLCCGDGVWSKGFQEINPRLELHGIDISEGGIEKAHSIMGRAAKNFVVGDAEADLPYTENYFDLIFARGPGLFNQHDMSHPEAVWVLEMWHRYLNGDGRFYAIFASTPKLMGTYTSMDNVVLPYNRAPRNTGAVKFSGGKYHHNIESFHAPFWKAGNVEIMSYSFVGNLHILVSRRLD